MDRRVVGALPTDAALRRFLTPVPKPRKPCPVSCAGPVRVGHNAVLDPQYQMTLLGKLLEHLRCLIHGERRSDGGRGRSELPSQPMLAKRMVSFYGRTVDSEPTCGLADGDALLLTNCTILGRRSRE
jgi:hypothetical protein